MGHPKMKIPSLFTHSHVFLCCFFSCRTQKICFSYTDIFHTVTVCTAPYNSNKSGPYKIFHDFTNLLKPTITLCEKQAKTQVIIP